MSAAPRARDDANVQSPDRLARPGEDGSGRGAETMAMNLSMPILVVEDHNATALILRTLLTRLGFSDVDEASDGLAAIAKMREDVRLGDLGLEYGADVRLRATQENSDRRS
jgi:PleD family two-component response regulator